MSAQDCSPSAWPWGIARQRSRRRTKTSARLKRGNARGKSRASDNFSCSTRGKSGKRTHRSLSRVPRRSTVLNRHVIGAIQRVPFDGCCRVSGGKTFPLCHNELFRRTRANPKGLLIVLPLSPNRRLTWQLVGGHRTHARWRRRAPSVIALRAVERFKLGAVGQNHPAFVAPAVRADVRELDHPRDAEPDAIQVRTV
jgi:hypothetical protein